MTERNEKVGRGVVLLVGVGVALGLAYNYAGLVSEPSFGLAWIGEQAELESLEDLLADGPAESVPVVDDGLPPLPEGRPFQLQLPAAKRLFDGGRALFIDARARIDYESGHIAGALNIPYEEAVPDRLEGLNTGGRPIVTYCGGGTCEVSMGLGWDLIHAGYRSVLVFMGGYAEWAAAGYPVARGPEPEERAVAEASRADFSTDIDDPLGFFGAAESLPEIPKMDRPLKMSLDTVKQFIDADAAYIIDARGAEEYAEGHIPGAVNLPYDEVIGDYARLESVDTGGEPIIAYCGGGDCEASMNLAFALVEAGHEKVLVYEGGFSEWAERGLAVARGSADR